ncbi:hypothetical protein RRG08_018914 [Elysia crispata]|uniref:Uncharacterized protein n=1 Tax=Elysia crispata TaxID=231223 RepID=A0AAE1A8R0_9GAST|nr:hypothetical protein RRG08_018914 [Elysia crispata]
MGVPGKKIKRNSYEKFIQQIMIPTFHDVHNSPVTDSRDYHLVDQENVSQSNTRCGKVLWQTDQSQDDLACCPLDHIKMFRSPG